MIYSSLFDHVFVELFAVRKLKSKTDGVIQSTLEATQRYVKSDEAAYA
jgi:hypothetical protein